MYPDTQKLVIIAGEASADLHGASLARALGILRPGIELSGIGGDRMRQAGVTICQDLTAHAVTGFTEILRHIQVFRRAFKSILRHIETQRPAAVILIDFPGFNLRLARALKRRFPQIKIIYYISPQVWAWGQDRVRLIRQVVDKMIVIFKFEEEFYRQRGVPAEFVGHPLLDSVRTTLAPPEARSRLEISPSNTLLSLLPGSRRNEIKQHLPLMLAAASLLRQHVPDIRCALVKADPLPEQLYRGEMQRYPDLPCSLVGEQRYDVIAASDFAWVCSGTATLETAILATPMIVIYRTSLVTWLLSRLLVKMPYIGLINIVAGEKVVPELIQFQATPRNLFRHTIDFLQQPPAERQTKRAQLEAVRDLLHPPGAAVNAARAVLNLLL
jgi:lipid-A-disaccharide synthase